MTSYWRGVALMIAAMAVFALADMFIKLVSAQISSAHTTLLLIGGGALVFGVLARAEGAPLLDRTALTPIMLVRYVSEIAGTFGIVLALALVPLSTVGAILQATPLVVTLGAVVFLGERVSWRRWSAIAVGFAGVLLIIQPGAAGFDLAILWPVVSMLGLSGRDLTTRMMRNDMSASALATFTMLAALPVAILWCLVGEGTLLPQGIPLMLVVAMIASGAGAYLLLIASIRSTDLSDVAPFRYSRLIFAMLLGIFLFGERPGTAVYLGAALIVASGLYTMWRGRRVG